MHPQRLNLPIGIQTFSQIISGGYYYVDKTRLAHLLTTQDKYYFLSRPRRFGKSLFLDTLKELFEGNEALFQGLHIHDKWDWKQRFPVIRISFGGGSLHSAEGLAQMMHKQLERHERSFTLPARYPDSRSRLTDLIERLHEQSGQLVVVLVDEYDKPILDNIGDNAAALAMRQGLRDFYSVIKDCDAHIRLAFLTGVSKFSKVSLFSGLNNLRDITVSPEYSALCGYTEQDVNTVFAAELGDLNRDKIKHWYNGYNWLGESVYNPFDLLLLFRERKFRPWWFESATPTFLIEILTKRQAWLPNLGQMALDSDLFSDCEVDNVSTAALMFQTGYLTIEREECIDDDYYYQLRFPNQEVRQSLYRSLLRAWVAGSDAGLADKKSLRQMLANCDFAALEGLFHTFFAGIPHQWHTKNHIAEYEGYYASVVYAWFAATGLDVRVEDATNLGRIDMAVKMARHIYLFEFKVVELAPNGKALQQIKDRGYADKYRVEGLPIHMIGVEFSKAKRNVTGFEVESLC